MPRSRSNNSSASCAKSLKRFCPEIRGNNMANDQFPASDAPDRATPLLHPEQPKLIVLEGIDLSGRTTQVQLLHDWLLAQRYHVTTTAWRTSPLISDVL